MDKIVRKKTKEVKIGNLFVGGENNIAVQSMTKTRTSNVEATAAQTIKLQDAGCDIIRVAIPDEASADAVSEIKSRIKIPLVADIHFDYRLAIKCLQSGADKVRINPGNIGGYEKAAEVLKAAKKYGRAVRIGVNSGSISKDLLEKYGSPTPEALYEEAVRYVEFAEKEKFTDLVISIKSSDVYSTYTSNMLFSKNCDYPLHLGVTEAGTYIDGIIKSSAGVGALLLNGIGDTIRISLSDDPIEEVRAGRNLLNLLGIQKTGIEVISCPTCGRCQTNVISYAKEVREKTKNINKYAKVAVMGCAVNGPGEAREADIGLAFGKNNAVMFEKGEIVKTVKENEAVEILLERLNDILNEQGSI
ncbi:MAG: flavodoxin-dependent (E)-4-hydroxy-3-methylbut-2-enyl-diphosphate synthase [Eubacteriaceae bacterium]